MFPNVDLVNSSLETQQPRGVFDFMLDTDFGLSEDDLFDTNFIPDLDRILDNTAPVPGFEDLHGKQLENRESASQRVAAFQRSFWYVFPYCKAAQYSQNQAMGSGEKSACFQRREKIAPAGW